MSRVSIARSWLLFKAEICAVVRLPTCAVVNATMSSEPSAANCAEVSAAVALVDKLPIYSLVSAAIWSVLRAPA